MVLRKSTYQLQVAAFAGSRINAFVFGGNVAAVLAHYGRLQDTLEFMICMLPDMKQQFVQDMWCGQIPHGRGWLNRLLALASEQVFLSCFNEKKKVASNGQVVTQNLVAGSLAGVGCVLSTII